MKIIFNIILFLWHYFIMLNKKNKILNIFNKDGTFNIRNYFIKNIKDADVRFNAYDLCNGIFNKNEYKCISQESDKFILHGGDNIKNYNITTEYKYNVTTIKDDEANLIHLIDFDEGMSCGTIEHYNNNECIISSLTNNKNCIKCNGNDVFNVGSILMQIMLHICFNKIKVNKVKLSDRSTIKLYNHSIFLIFFRTMTKGQPYYAKYGFLPYEKQDKEVYLHNIKIFNENPIINVNVFLKILEKYYNLNFKL